MNSKLSNNNHGSRIKSKNKSSTFAFGKLRGLGCKGMAMPVPATRIRSSAEERTPARRKRNHIRARNPANLADTPDICCAPPGIIYLSDDVVPRPPNMAAQPQRTTTHTQQSGVVRRRVNNNGASASATVLLLSRSNHQVSNARQCHHLYFRFSRESSDGEDQHRNWRLNVDTMSYEELVDLGEKIGHVSKGLCEEEIFHCLKISKLSMAESFVLLVSSDKDWRCSICQEGWHSSVEVGRLGCGHCHHMNCLRQWLLQKNECPICKIPPTPHKAWKTMI